MSYSVRQKKKSYSGITSRTAWIWIVCSHNPMTAHNQPHQDSLSGPSDQRPDDPDFKLGMFYLKHKQNLH